MLRYIHASCRHGTMLNFPGCKLLLCTIGLAFFCFLIHQFLFYDYGYSDIQLMLQGPPVPNDTVLVKYVRNHLLWPPSTLPYNLSNPNQRFFFEDKNNTPEILDALFHKQRNLVFVEAGAFDGETVSLSLYLERDLGWTGLLAEPNTELHNKLKSKHRKATIFPGCLSTKAHPEQVEFTPLDLGGHINGKMNSLSKHSKFYKCDKSNAITRVLDGTKVAKDFYERCKRVGLTIKVQCMPLETLLLAANISRVDLLSLDVEGSEVDVISQFPFYKFDIKVIRVEALVVPEDSIFEAMRKTKLYKELEKYKNRSELTDGDIWFVKRDYPVDRHFTLREL